MLNGSNVQVQYAKNQLEIRKFLKTESHYEISHECFCDILIIYTKKNDIHILFLKTKCHKNLK